PPAGGGGVGEERAGVVFSRGDGYGVGEADDGDGGVPVSGGAVAELAVEVGSPAARGPVREERAGVVCSRPDGHGVNEAADGDGRGRVGGGAVAELAEAVPS